MKYILLIILTLMIACGGDYTETEDIRSCGGNSIDCERYSALWCRAIVQCSSAKISYDDCVAEYRTHNLPSTQCIDCLQQIEPCDLYNPNFCNIPCGD